MRIDMGYERKEAPPASDPNALGDVEEVAR